jgi:hypothetical protein
VPMVDIFPNDGFLEKLRAYELKKRGESTVSDALFQLHPMQAFHGGRRRRNTKKSRKTRRKSKRTAKYRS